MTVAPDPHPAPARRSVGRPRRLTLEAIVDAACALGLERIEMGLVAQRLNTGMGTLYGYVRSREHLLSLVAERLAAQYRVEDRGQDWRQLLRDHGEMTAAVFAAMPHLIGELLEARNLERGYRYAEWFIDLLVARGLDRDRAIDLYIEATHIIIGAAICGQRRRILVAAQGADAGTVPDVLGDHRPTLERLIRDVDAAVAPAGDGP